MDGNDTDEPRPVSDLRGRRRTATPGGNSANGHTGGPDDGSDSGPDGADPEADPAAGPDAGPEEEWRRHQRRISERHLDWLEAQQGPLRGQLRESLRQHRAAVREDGPFGLVDFYLDGGRAWWEIGAALLLVVTAAATVLGAVGGLLLLAFSVVVALWQGAVEGLTTVGIPQTIYDPVTGYLDRHAAGLPITPDALAGTWLAVEAVLLVCACLGSAGARAGWCVMGAVTVAMVWAGTIPDASRATAAGVAAAVWCVLSIVAFRGAFRRARIVVVPTQPVDRDPT